MSSAYHSLHLLDGDIVEDHGANVLQLRTVGEYAVHGHLGGDAYI